MDHPTTRGKQRTSGAQRTLFQTPGSSRAVWDNGATEIFLELVRNEKFLGNFGGQKTLNATGYKNVMQHLLARTGNEYSQKQIKNKFEYLRTDYKCWVNLIKNETGIGWNSISGTIDADDAWWNLKIAQDKNAAKFRDKGLEHMGLLDEIFSDLMATGEYQYTPSATNFGEYCDSRSTPQRPESMETSGFDAQRAARDEEVNSPIRGSTSRFRGQSQSRSGSKRKSNEFDEWSNQVESLKKSYMDSQSSDRRYHHIIETPQAPADPNAQHMQECVSVLDAIEGLNGRDPLYQAGLEAFELRKKRSIWLCIKDDESRLIWLQRQMKLQNR